MEGHSNESAPPVDEAAGLLETVLSSPFEAEREALWAEALEQGRDALLDVAVDRLLSAPPADGWLAERVAEALGPAAPGRLLGRASSAPPPSFPDRTSAIVRSFFRGVDSATARLVSRSLDSPNVATAFVAAAAAGTLAPDGGVPTSLLAGLGAPAPSAALGRLCAHPEPALRRAAAQALALLPPRDAIAPLENFAADAEPPVRSACYWAVRVLSLTDPGASQLLALAIHVEDDPELRTMLDGLLSAAPLPPLRIDEIVRSVGTLDGPAKGADLDVLAGHVDEIPDEVLLELVHLACALFVVAQVSGSPALRKRLRSVAVLLRRPSLGLFEERSPLRGWDAFVTGAFLAVATSGDEDPLVLSCETKSVLDLVSNEPFLTDDMKRAVDELTETRSFVPEMEDRAKALGLPDPSAAFHLALVTLVHRGDPLRARQRVRLDDTSGQPLHFRLRSLGEAIARERGLDASLRDGSLLPGVGGLAALLAGAALRDAASFAELRARVLAGEADRHDLVLAGTAFLLPNDDREPFLENLDASGRAAFAARVRKWLGDESSS